MLRPRPFRGAGRMRHVAERVEDRLRPAARPVGGSELGEPVGGRMPGEREGARRGGALGDRDRDHVGVRADGVRGVVAGREQCLVVGGSDALAVRVELGRPVRAVVRVVPDRHVVDLRVVAEQVGDERAVLGARVRGSRRVLWVAVDAGDHPDPPRVEHHPLQRELEGGGHLRLARLPLERHPHGLQPQGARDGGGLLGVAPEERVLLGADEEAPGRRRCGGSMGRRRECDGHRQGEQLAAEAGHPFFIGRQVARLSGLRPSLCVESGACAVSVCSSWGSRSAGRSRRPCCSCGRPGIAPHVPTL